MTLDFFTDQKVIHPDKIIEHVRGLKANGHRIVTLNGSFDLLHAGHLFILYEAKRQGDLLCVALNSDASIQAYKSPDRPIISLKERMQMMAALEVVDLVTWFDELDPREILKKIRPDVHVNGAEYTENCIEAECVREIGARLHLAPRIPALSTSDIIKKIVSCEREARL
ncbi:MAG: adenylyltransferase/cytidyltransferase family protein [Simkaniaceae bacterium]|nr:adenylyltransferase/cytidyltransferase family protein [Simkaniaceae bacterium]